MASRLAAALDYRDQGRSVIPVEPNSKIPAVRWGRFQVERATESQIRRWWDFADFNVGIVCGRISNLIALDVDLRAGGNASLARLEAAHRPVGGLEVATPGGLHRWFAHPGRTVPNSTSVLGPGLDVKADGGMIVVPPSERPDGAYRFGRLFDADVPPLPDWLATLLVDQQKPRTPPRRPTGRRPSARYLDAAVRGVLADLRATTEGDRNNTLFKATCRILELGATDAVPAVEQIAREIGLGRDEIDETVASARRRVGACADGADPVFRARGLVLYLVPLGLVGLRLLLKADWLARPTKSANRTATLRRCCAPSSPCSARWRSSGWSVAMAEPLAARVELDRHVPERELQRQITDLAELTGWRWFHVYDSRRSPAGFPDLVLVRRGRLIFFEVKSASGRISRPQAAWLLDLAQVSGVVAMVVRPSDWPKVQRLLQGGT